MRWDDLYLAGVGTYLPKQVQTAEEAVALGLYDAKENIENGIHEVRTADDEEAPPVMAAAAGKQAVTRSGHSPEEFGLVLHASIGHQGQDFWTPAHYVQHETVGGRGAALEVRQGANGGMAAVELAASYLAARPDETAALVTVADAFRAPYFERWSSDSQQVYGDGAAAVVLSKRGGFARLLSTASLSDSVLEPVYRGVHGWTPAPFADGRPVDLRGRKRDYLLRSPGVYEQVMGRMSVNAQQVLSEALEDAGTELGDIQFFLHANVVQSIATFFFQNLLGIDRSRTAYDWGRGLGHVGGADQLIGLNHLVETGRLAVGDRVLALGFGVGFMWTVAVLEVLSVPASVPDQGSAAW